MSITIPNFSFKNDIRFIPLYDIHVGANSFDEKAFLNTVDYIKKNKNVYWALDGDCLENVTADCVADPYSQSILPHDQAEYLISMLKPIKHRATYSIIGNHVSRTRKRAYYDILVSISRELNLEYLGIGGYVNFQVGKQKYIIATQHGDSGGSNWELEVKKLRHNYPEAHMYIMGHNHKLCFDYKPYIAQNKFGEETHKYCIFCRAGNFLGFADYARSKSYEMQIVGNMNIKFSSKYHSITGYKMQYVNGVPIFDNFNNVGTKVKRQSIIQNQL